MPTLFDLQIQLSLALQVLWSKEFPAEGQELGTTREIDELAQRVLDLRAQVEQVQ